MLFSGCCAVSEHPAVCVWKRSVSDLADFAPYFSRVLVGDPVKGQAVVADISTVYGVITALTAPLLGASIECSVRTLPPGPGW